MNHIELGKYGEDMACKHLKENEYEIIKRNYRVKGGETDIIAYKDNKLVFVEVKTRRNKKFGLPSEAVNYKKQKRLKNSAMTFVQQLNNVNNYIEEYRFDVIEVFVKAGNVKINHLKGAF